MEYKGESDNDKLNSFKENANNDKADMLDDNLHHLLMRSSNSDSKNETNQKLSSDEKPSSGSKPSNEDSSKPVKEMDNKDKEYLKKISRLSETSRLNKSDDSMLVAWFANKLREDNEHLVRDCKSNSEEIENIDLNSTLNKEKLYYKSDSFNEVRNYNAGVSNKINEDTAHLVQIKSDIPEEETPADESSTFLDKLNNYEVFKNNLWKNINSLPDEIKSTKDQDTKAKPNSNENVTGYSIDPISNKNIGYTNSPRILSGILNPKSANNTDFTKDKKNNFPMSTQQSTTNPSTNLDQTRGLPMVNHYINHGVNYSYNQFANPQTNTIRNLYSQNHVYPVLNTNININNNFNPTHFSGNNSSQINAFSQINPQLQNKVNFPYPNNSQLINFNSNMNANLNVSNLQQDIHYQQSLINQNIINNSLAEQMKRNSAPYTQFPLNNQNDCLRLNQQVYDDLNKYLISSDSINARYTRPQYSQVSDTCSNAFLPTNNMPMINNVNNDFNRINTMNTLHLKGPLISNIGVTQNASPKEKMSNISELSNINYINNNAFIGNNSMKSFMYLTNQSNGNNNIFNSSNYIYNSPLVNNNYEMSHMYTNNTIGHGSKMTHDHFQPTNLYNPYQQQGGFNYNPNLNLMRPSENTYKDVSKSNCTVPKNKRGMEKINEEREGKVISNQTRAKESMYDNESSDDNSSHSLIEHNCHIDIKHKKDHRDVKERRENKDHMRKKELKDIKEAVKYNYTNTQNSESKPYSSKHIAISKPGFGEKEHKKKLPKAESHTHIHNAKLEARHTKKKEMLHSNSESSRGSPEHFTKPNVQEESSNTNYEFQLIKSFITANSQKDLFKYIFSSNKEDMKANAHSLTNFIFSLNTNEPKERKYFGRLLKLLESVIIDLCTNKDQYFIVKAVLIKSESNNFKHLWNIISQTLQSLCFNQYGSIIVQQAFKLIYTSELENSKTELWNTIKRNFLELSCHRFGVHLVKSILIQLTKENNLTYFFPVEKSFIELITNCYGVTMIKICVMVISPLRFEPKKLAMKEMENLKTKLLNESSKHTPLTLSDDLFYSPSNIGNESKKKRKNNDKNDESEEEGNESFEALIDTSYTKCRESPSFSQFLSYSSQMRKRIMTSILFNFDHIIFNKYGHYGLLFMIRTWGSVACLEFLNTMLANIDYYMVYSYPLKIIKKIMTDLDKETAFEYGFKMISSIRNLVKLLKFRLGGKSLRLALSYLNKEEAENFLFALEKDSSIKEVMLNQVKSIVNTVQFKFYPKVKMNLIPPLKANKKEETENNSLVDIHDNKGSNPHNERKVSEDVNEISSVNFEENDGKNIKHNKSSNLDYKSNTSDQFHCNFPKNEN